MKYLCTLLIFSFPFLLSAQTLTIQEDRFYMDNQPFEMWGIRVASASQTDSLTNQLISALDSYKAYGVNTINVYLQGSSGKFSDPFSKNGKKIDKGHLKRLQRIIDACADRNMVVIAGIFYQRVMNNMDDSRNLQDEAAVRNATRTVAKKLKPYKNVIINIANEQNSSFYQAFEAFQFNDPQNIIDLCKLVKETNPESIAGGGGYQDSSNVIIGKSEYVDVLLFDTFSGDIENGHHSGWHYDYFRKMGITGKPMVNVEIFGGWTKKFMPPGVYTEEGKKIHIQEIVEAKKRPGLSVHFHSNPWCQPPKEYPIRYDLGGMGTEQDPGILWWFKAIGQ